MAIVAGDDLLRVLQRVDDNTTAAAAAAAAAGPGVTLGVGQVSVLSTPTLIVAANANRRSVVICNLGTSTLFLGGAGVSAITGHGVPANAAVSFGKYTGALYGILASGSQTASYCEEAA